MYKKPGLYILLILLVLSVSSITACDNPQQKLITPKPTPETSEENGQEASNRRIITSRFSTIAENVEGVKRASVIISSVNNRGNTILLSTNPESKNNSRDRDNITYNNMIRYPDINTDNLNVTTDDNQSNMTADLAVLAGLTLNNDNADEEAIKAQVAEKIKSADASVSEVLVSTDPETVKRISHIASQIIQGIPASSYAKDIDALRKEIRSQF